MKCSERCDCAGRIAWHVSWVYGGLCMAVFLVRTMKRIIFHEARQYSAFQTCNAVHFTLAISAWSRCQSLCTVCIRNTDAKEYCIAGVDSTAHNYVLLGLALLQFPFTYYLGIRPGK